MLTYDTQGMTTPKWLSTCALACSIAVSSVACSDDTSDSPRPGDDVDATVPGTDAGDAAVSDTDSVADGGVIEGDAELPALDGAVAWDGAAIWDSAVDDGSLPPLEDGSVGDADIDAGGETTPDAQVFVPEGGVVLRPVELEFDAERVSELEVPAGFAINVFAQPTGQTRMLAAHDGAVYVTRPTEGDVLRLVDPNDDGVAEIQAPAIAGLEMVHGITFHNDTVYLATPTQLLRATVAADGSFGAPEVLIDDLPDGGQHPLRTLGIGPDDMLYISIGSSCDACAESNPEHATILRATLDGATRAIFASGLRNTIGFGWHPTTDELWGMDNGSDWRGNELPPEELNLIAEGNNYGWPYCYGTQEVDPIIADPEGQSKEQYCATTTPSVLTNQAHEAPIGMTFYEGAMFPEEYQADAFVAMRGSWNRIPATGYKIVRIDFDEAGQPLAIEDFVSGFLAEDGLETFARPAGVTVAGDGSLLFSDDTNGVIYRVSVEE